MTGNGEVAPKADTIKKMKTHKHYITMLTKTDFMSYMRCPLELWLRKYQKHLIPAVDAATQRLFDAGNEIDYLARKLYPEGEEIEEFSVRGWNSTQKAMKKGARILYQPTGMTGDLMAKADILTSGSEPGVWDIREVKITTKVKDDHIIDLAFQKICFEEAGIRIGKTYLVHINNRYVRRGQIDVKQLLIAEDVTAKVLSILKKTRQQITSAIKYLEDHRDFSELLIQSCSNPRKCVLLGSCISAYPEVYAVADKLPKKYLLAILRRGLLDPSRLSPALLKKIGYSDPVPFHEVDTKRLKNILEKLEYPLYFIDYETYGPAIPPFDKIRPYQGIPFQFSLFIRESKNSKLKFEKFLALELENPVPAFLSHLKENIGPAGSIVVWNAPFEAGKNKEMAILEPEYKKFLTDMNKRMFDLMLIFKFKRKLYIHSGFEKRHSLKMVLPVIIPELSYNSLAIQVGGTASASWPVLVNPATTERAKKKLAYDMLEYCKRDSEAMVRILAHLYERIEE